MASPILDTQTDRARLYMFTRVLTLKVAQIVVQSRQGKKITTDSNHITKQVGQSPPSSPPLQLFNLSVPDEPEVNTDTNHVLNGEVINALSNVFCIEIALQTSEGDDMVLEMWTVRMTPGSDQNVNSVSTIYYRMGVMLKSTLSISRITPAYKMSRSQDKESYKIYHKIYGGQPNLELLGENYKVIKISELHMPIGTMLIEVTYRTKMTILPDDKPKFLDNVMMTANGGMMVKSDHFPSENPKSQGDRRELDLSKPLTAGAFVDTLRLEELHNTLSQQLPPEPPMAWLLAEKEKLESRMNDLSLPGVDIAKPGFSGEVASFSAPTSTKAIEVPKSKDIQYNSLMLIPFAGGSPMAELANFYKDCLQARSVSDEWTDVVGDVSASTDSESLSQQLKMFEDAVPEFDNMVASMFNNSDYDNEHS